jgi:predicted N-acetyltransferase YhbS
MSDPAWTLRPETPADAAAVEALNAASFGPGRFAKSAYRLREGVAPVAELGFVATQGDVLLGSVRFWPISVGGHEELLLGPLAVRGDQRGKGIGIALMQAGIEAAQKGPWRGILLVGDEPYYAKVGFSRLPPGRVRFPGPVDERRMLGLSLKGGEMLTVSGQIRRARIDEANCADGSALG